jgi:plastocyanin
VKSLYPKGMKVTCLASLDAAVITGLGVGIAFILLFAIMFENHRTTVPFIGRTISEVIIPYNATMMNNPSFEPNSIKVMIGVNNTVRWVNQDDAGALIAADNESDPAFFNATKDFVFILPNKTFDYTFTKAGEFGYHGKPWQRGTVVVLSSR